MIDKKSNTAGFILVLLSTIFWGMSFISTKIVLTEVPPVSIAFFRQVIALVPLFLWAFFSKTSLKIALKDFFLLAFSCFFGIVLYFVFENNGLKYTSASNASMIVASVPVFTLLAEVLFFRFKANLKMLLCITVSITGVYLVISINGRLDFSSARFLGNAMVLGAMISWVIYTILSRNLGTKYSSLVITIYQTAISLFLFIPFIIPESGNWKGVTLVPLLNLLYLGIFCSALSYFFFLYGIKKLGATVSSTFLNLIPVVSVIAGYIILGERLGIIQLAGMSLIIGSLWLLNNKLI